MSGRRIGARARKFVSLLAGLALASSFTGLAGAKKAGEMSDTWVFYTRSVGSAGTLGGSFTADAALVRTDASIPAVPRIGFFRRAMSPGEWDGLASAIRSLGAPRPSGRHSPGTPMVSVGIMAKGKAEVVHGQPGGALTPAEKEVFSKVEATVEDVMRTHPHKALEGAAAWERDSVGPDDDVGVGVRVSNPGLVPVPFVHPTSREGGSSGFSVVLARVGAEGVTVEAREVVFSPAEVVEVGPDGKVVKGPYGGIVELAPGKEIRFRARSRLRLVPASYRATARMDLDAPEGSDEKAVKGTIVVELPALAVVRPGERGGNP